jgi:hypothetical protein
MVSKDARPVQLNRNGPRTLAAGVVFEDTTDDGGLANVDHAIDRGERAAREKLTIHSVAIADAACRLAGPTPAFEAPRGLLRQLPQEECLHRAT